MKNKLWPLIFVGPLLLFSCNNGVKHTASPDDYNLIKGPEQCFTAVYQKDSAFLKYKSLPDGKIQGKLVIKYGELELLAQEKEFYHGYIKGNFNGDTLFADYSFTNGDKKAIYRNPIALLNKGGKLAMGSGVTINYLGRTWFRDHSTINFNKCRFVFVAAGCGGIN